MEIHANVSCLRKLRNRAAAKRVTSVRVFSPTSPIISITERIKPTIISIYCNSYRICGHPFSICSTKLEISCPDVTVPISASTRDYSDGCDRAKYYFLEKTVLLNGILNY